MDGKCPGATDDRRPGGRSVIEMGLGDRKVDAFGDDESIPWRLIEAEGYPGA